MKIGVALPTDHTKLAATANTVETLIDQVRELAAAGLTSAWLTQRFDHDAVTVAGLAAREVPDIEIGTAGGPAYPPPPIALSIQGPPAPAASHGRFTLGVGLSVKSFVEQVYGIAPHPRIRHLREFLQALESLLETGSVDMTGETVVARSAFPA